MRAENWIKRPVESLLDVGCNVGAWLHHCCQLYPGAKLAGIEINGTALEAARKVLPGVDLRQAGAESIPFDDAAFQYVTCIEVLEHLPVFLRATAFSEMRRVLRPGGRLILTVPHAGWFAWLDPNNVRFRVPKLYQWLVGRGRRDAVYESVSRTVEWHHHFTEEELRLLAGEGWNTDGVCQGGLLVYPLMAWCSWPFYRLNASHHPLRRLCERLAEWDYRINYGRASYGILLALERDDLAR